MNKLLNFESILVILFVIFDFLYFSTNYFSKYGVAVVNLWMFIIYSFLYGIPFRHSLLSRIVISLGIIIFLSSFNNHTSLYNATYFEKLGVSLIGINTYCVVSNFLIRNKDKVDILRYFSYIFWAIGIVLYIYRNTVVAELLSEEGFYSNTFYYILMPLPLIVYFIRGFKRDLIFILAFFLIAITAKRSGIIIMTLLSIPFVLTYLKRFKRDKIIFQMMIFLSVVFYLYYTNFFSNDIVGFIFERFNNLSEDHGSGRIDIAALALKDISNYSTEELLLGRGYGSFAFYHDYASPHNDYVDILYSYGIFGFLCFLLIVLYLITSMRKLKMREADFPFYVFLTIFLVINFTGGIFFFYDLTLPIFIYMALYSVVFINKPRHNYDSQKNSLLLVRK